MWMDGRIVAHHKRHAIDVGEVNTTLEVAVLLKSLATTVVKRGISHLYAGQGRNQQATTSQFARASPLQELSI